MVLPIVNMRNPRTKHEIEGERLARQERRRKEAFRNRKDLFNQICPPTAQEEGIVNNMVYQAKMDQYGQIGYTLTMWILQLFKAFFQVFYRMQKRQFSDAQKAKNAYEEKADGTWPEIFPLNGRGEPDFNQTPNVDGTAERADIRGNGYVPPPSWQEACSQHYADFVLKTLGHEYLSEDQKEKLRCGAERGGSRDEDKDRAQMEAQRQAALRASMHRPKLGGKNG